MVKGTGNESGPTARPELLYFSVATPVRAVARRSESTVTGSDVSEVFVRSSLAASRAAGVIILVVGLGLIVLSLIADSIGLGGGRGFGYQQLIVLIVGMVAVLFGGAILLQPRTSNQHDPPYIDDSDAGPRS
jgi:hypothetical protein